jgi:HlyD family secretion protein
MNEQAMKAQRSLRRHMVLGVATVALLLGGVGGWAATSDIAGAVVSSGSVVVDTNVKKVQHQTGGTVKELLVRDGTSVQGGDVVIRLDDTQTRASLSIVSKSLAELFARQARLEAERDGSNKLDFTALRQMNLPDSEKLVSGETKLFELRRTVREGQKAQLNERKQQLREEIEGLTGQIGAKAQEVALIQNELKGVRDLFQKNLIPIQRVTVLERDAVRLGGERNVLTASMAQAKGKISEIELQILQIEQDLRGEVAKELREIQGKVAELQERRVAAEDTLQKIDIRAPQSGRVHQLATHTVGGVISPGETAMVIVPERDSLIIEARVAPQDIDQLHQGQQAILRFSAANQRTTPEINGEVRLVSPDVTTDQKSGTSYFTVRIGATEEEIARLGSLRLVPGMQVEAFIQTGQRTVLSYLVKPMEDQIMRSFRER